MVSWGLLLTLLIELAAPAFAVPAMANSDKSDPGEAVVFKYASPEDIKLPGVVVKNCSGAGSCVQSKINTFAAQARSDLKRATIAFSPDMEYLTNAYCGIGAASETGISGQKSVNNVECQMKRTSRLQVDTREFLAKVDAKSFEDLKKLPGAENSWQFQLYNEYCKGSNATFACLKNHLLQLQLDLGVVVPAFGAYYHNLVKASELSEVICPTSKGKCAFKGLSPSDLKLASRPAYQRTVPPPPPAAKSSGDSVGPGAGGPPGTGGAGDRGAGKGGGGKSDHVNTGEGEGNSPKPGEAKGGGKPGGTSDKTLAGAKGGVKGGASCKDQGGNPIDCDAQALIQLSDPGVEVLDGPFANCPAFLKPYNCLGMGSNLAGDLTNIRNAPYFAASREKMCRERVKLQLGFAYAGVSAKWEDPSVSTLAHSSGCDYLIEKLGGEDPVPPLTRQDIDTARVTGSGNLFEVMTKTADILSEGGLEHDLGAYSLQQKAIALFQVKVNLEPGILTDADPAAYNAAVAELLSAAGCLSSAEKELLTSQLKAARQGALANAQVIRASKAELDKKWVESLVADSEKATSVDRANFDLSHLWGRLRCDGSFLGDAAQCLKYDYKSVAAVDEPVSAEVYASRLRWIKSDLGAALALPGAEPDNRWGNILQPGLPTRPDLKPGVYQDQSCSYVHCSDLHLAVESARRRENELYSGNPLLAQTTGASIQRRECGTDPAERDPGRVRWSKVTQTFDSCNSPLTDGFAAISSFAGADETACLKPQNLADKLMSDPDPSARLAAARAAAEKMRGEGLGGIRNVCSKAGGLTEEGKHAAGVQAIAQGFLNCRDIGEFGKACEDRRSYGWAMCRLHQQNVADRNTQQIRDTFQGMAMAAGGALAIMATAGGALVVAGVLGLGMSATSIYLRHKEISDSSQSYAAVRSDFIAKLGDHAATKAAWERMSEAEKNAVAGDVFDLATAALDAHALTGALKTAAKTVEAGNAARRVAFVDQLIKDGKDLDALAHARKLRGAEETLSAVEKLGGTEARAEVLADMRAGLRRYGPIVDVIAENDLATLQNLESRVRTLLRDGMIDESVAARVRRQISEALVSPEKLKQLAGSEVSALFYEMQASGRFTGPGGRALQDRFIEIFEGMIRDQHPELTEQMWSALGRDEKLAILEGKLNPVEALAHHPELAKAAAKAKAASGGKVVVAAVEDARGGNAVAKAAGTAEEINASKAVSDYRERYRTFGAIGEADNGAYIAMVDGPQVEGRLYFEAENAVLKQLNDSVIVNKDTVTALGNHYKEMLFGAVQDNPLLRSKLTAQYSDFKSMRLVFTEDTAAIRAELEKVYERVGMAFEAEVAKSPLKDLYKEARGINGSPSSWHLAGIGSTADEASISARSARSDFRAGKPNTQMRSFDSLTGRLIDRLDAIEELRAQMQPATGTQNGMFVAAKPGSSKLVLSDDAFEILRKVDANGLEDYVKKVTEKFEIRFKVKLTPEEVLNIREYQSHVDGFTASIVSPKRVVINLKQAEQYGVLSFDMAGAGAANLERTAGELAASAGGGPSAAIAGARNAEKNVTSVMKQKLEAIRGAVGEVLGPGAASEVAATGDDVYYFPKKALSVEQRQAIQAGVTRRMGEQGFTADRLRTTFQPPNFATGGVIPSGVRSTYIVDAEKIEKKLRATLEGPIDFHKFKDVGIMVDYTPGAGGTASMSIFLTGKVDAATAEKIRAQAETLMPKGVQLKGVTVAPSGV